jgi:PAS domain S-box-containing protein
VQFQVDRREGGAIMPLTKRIEVEEALRLSEARFRSVLDNSVDIIYRYNLQTKRYEYMSPSVEQILGYSVDEMLAITTDEFVALVHPDDVPAVLADLARLEETGRGRMEARYRAKSGEYRWLATRMHLTRDDAGRPLYRYGNTRDITERKRMEAALRESEERYSALFANKINGIAHCRVIADEHGRPVDYLIVQVNEAYEQIIGITKAEIEGRRVTEVFAGVENYSFDYIGVLGKVGLEGGEIQFESFLESTQQYLSIYAYSPRPGEFTTIITDVTAHRRAEEALRESEERLHLASKAAGFGTYTYDFQSHVGYWSPEAKALWGLQATDPVPLDADNLGCFLHPEDRPGLLAAMMAANDPGGNGLLENDHRIIWPDGSIHWLHVCGRTEFAGDGAGRKPWRAAGAVVDITRMKQEEEKRIALEQRLREAVKLESAGRLAGGIAHEFNNLLLAIRTYTELMQSSLPMHGSLREKTEQVLNAAERGARLTGQMLAFSRKQIVSRVALDLNAVIAQATDMLKRLVGEHIELKFAGADSLWRIEADQDQMFQVLMNLCMNARDAMPQGGTLTIATENVRVISGDNNLSPGDYVKFSVTDTGIGISKEVQQQIFEPFFTTKEVGKGTGLGLATVYGIVQQSAGQVTVDSEPGRGACFAVYLPKTERTFSSGESVRAEAHQRGSGTLLVVEDEEFLRKGISEFLGSLGYNVLTAGSGEEALLVAGEQGHIDLLLTDVVMPKMSGRELSETLCALRPDLKVIYMSGYTDDAVLRSGIDHLNAAFLQKPFGLAKLGRKVRETLDGAK